MDSERARAAKRAGALRRWREYDHTQNVQFKTIKIRRDLYDIFTGCKTDDETWTDYLTNLYLTAQGRIGQKGFTDAPKN